MNKFKFRTKTIYILIFIISYLIVFILSTIHKNSLVEQEANRAIDTLK